MKEIRVEVVDAGGVSLEQQAKAIKSFKEQITKLYVEGKLNAELVLGIEEGRAFGLAIGKTPPPGLDENALNPVEHYPPHVTDLTITFRFMGGPWTFPERHEREAEVIRYFEAMAEGRKAPPTYAFIHKGSFTGQGAAVSFTDKEYKAMPEDAVVCLFVHEGDDLPLKANGWMWKKDLTLHFPPDLEQEN